MRFITLLNKIFSGGFEREPGFPSNSELVEPLNIFEKFVFPCMVGVSVAVILPLKI
jgi:hypothetical protein